MGAMRLRTLWESVIVDEDWNGVWMKNLNAINMEFLETMISIS